MPEIAYANAFIGNYLRLILLMRFGLHQQALDEVRLYFGKMARLTGTLWENDPIRDSLNHAFSSFGTVLINHCSNLEKIRGFKNYEYSIFQTCTGKI